MTKIDPHDLERVNGGGDATRGADSTTATDSNDEANRTRSIEIGSGCFLLVPPKNKPLTRIRLADGQPVPASTPTPKPQQ